MLQTVGVSLSFAKRTLFDDVNLSFTKGNCYGIIGANGAGKSTFLKILSGTIEPNKGQVEIGKGERVSTLSQDHNAFDDYTVLHTVMMGHKQLWNLYQAREAIYAKEDFSERDGIKAAEIETEFGELGGYNAENDAAALLDELLVSEQLHHTLMKTLSGDIKVKVLLAQALFAQPDILLLDEPTNDLDVRTIMWLENFLANYKNIILVVSHDRHFLDVVCTHIVDIDKQKATIYTGNYTFWYESSQLMARQIADKNKKTEDKRKELIEFIQRFSANASKSRQATSRKKALEKLVIEDIKPSNRRYPGIFFKPERELGNQILSVKGLSKTLDTTPLFGNIQFDIEKKQKVGIVSQNALAVSYFFDILEQEASADAGDLQWGTTTIRAYLPADNKKYFQTDDNLLDWLRQFVPSYIQNVDEHFLRGFLGRMLFGGDEVFKNVSVLSGGEKARCMISRMMLQNPNVLLIDQPTNHLDLESITAFNNAIANFPGVVLLASHDIEFMRSCVNRIIEITPHGCIDQLMTYDEYLQSDKVRDLQSKYYDK